MNGKKAKALRNYIKDLIVHDVIGQEQNVVGQEHITYMQSDRKDENGDPVLDKRISITYHLDTDGPKSLYKRIKKRGLPEELVTGMQKLNDSLDKEYNNLSDEERVEIERLTKILELTPEGIDFHTKKFSSFIKNGDLKALADYVEMLDPTSD
jgi:hypothetical protein